MCKRKYNKFCFAYLCQPFKLHHRTSNWIRVFGSIERDNKLTYFMFIRFVARNVLHFVKREATLARESLFFTSSLTTYAIYTKKIVVNNYISWLLESYILTCIIYISDLYQMQDLRYPKLDIACLCYIIISIFHLEKSTGVHIFFTFFCRQTWLSSKLVCKYMQIGMNGSCIGRYHLPIACTI